MAMTQINNVLVDEHGRNRNWMFRSNVPYQKERDRYIRFINDMENVFDRWEVPHIVTRLLGRSYHTMCCRLAVLERTGKVNMNDD